MTDTARRPTVVLPRGGEWAERIGREARARGLEPVTIPLITTAPPADPAPLTAALAALARGEFAWIAVTSATAARVIGGLVPSLPAGVRVAAVGRETAAACLAAGWPVDFVPTDESARGLAAEFPETDGTVLFPCSEIATVHLMTGLRDRGIALWDVAAYRTVGTGTAPIVLDPPPDAILVTSGSVASAIALRMRPLDPRTRVACIGPGTASAAGALGLPVHVTSPSRSVPALLDAVVADLQTSPNHPTPER
ncbi:uroporphyrinogen-III synthase [Curtobacterium sp. Leaf261]|uniref:uroporphyrinogen-III synthase n=1 Tax=Curtobacterium sp. Leaf261 TaxID=1736311 RepID=UPI0006FD5732|nr:uroporphyrinogen-III synthase [Curtobacterium sp. Leaf261]KQO63804.1 hypothetical protein ASF23_06255 [Curtobacterium sp. Leaf261]